MTLAASLILSAALVLTGGFRDGISCTVQGYVYSMPDEPPAFGSPNGCTGIRWRLDTVNRAVIFWSPYTVVTIPLPERTDGQMLLQYHWGNDTAQLGGKAQRVYAEPTSTG